MVCTELHPGETRREDKEGEEEVWVVRCAEKGGDGDTSTSARRAEPEKVIV